jgi:Ala-tRNA(Pro) deacylase
MKTKEFLDKNRIAYQTYEVEETCDAQHLAAALRVPGCHIAKTVLLRADSGFKYYLLVLSACDTIDFSSLSKVLGGASLRLATELEISERCPDCDVGILPPFGSRMAAETLVDEKLTKHQDLFFRGDSHCEAIRMKYHDFVQLEHPTVVRAALATETKTACSANAAALRA